MASRGRNYSDEELKQLCLSVLHVSQDPIVGAGQRAEKFWDRVFEQYEKSKPKGAETRGRKSLEGKWADIKHDVSKFMGCFEQVEGRQVSGTNADDTVKLAKELYRVNHPKNRNFTYDSCFNILKECPRFWNPSDEMAKGKAKRRSSTGTVLLDTAMPTLEVLSNSDDEAAHDIEDGNESAPSFVSKKRPIGNRKAKEALKRGKLHDDALKMSAVAQKDMALANLQRNKIAENNSRMVLLSMPIETMDPTLQQFMRDWKLEEARSLKEQMKQRVTEGSQPPTAQADASPIVSPVVAPAEQQPPVQSIAVESTTGVNDGEDDLAAAHEQQERISREQFEFEEGRL